MFPILTLSSSIFRNQITIASSAICIWFTPKFQKATMKTLAGSKRKTGTTFASPTKAAASTKRSRTQYDYYDEEDSESLPEYRWSAGDTDSGSEMSLDEDEHPIRQTDSPSDKPAASLRGSRSYENSWSTEVMPTVKFTKSLLISTMRAANIQSNPFTCLLLAVYPMDVA